MLLITGLGNPGEKYAQTRHNIGFLFVDYLSQKHMFSAWKLEKKWQGLVAKGSINGEKVILLKPQTFMNESGQSVQPLTHYYQIPTAESIVITDDLDQDFGAIKWKTQGGSGGHNGLKSITKHLGTNKFPRLKMGINNELKSRMQPGDFVLKKFTKEELSKLSEVFACGEKTLLDNLRHIE
jgi:PTH1 family peptidyl-tRNA hydrolase